MSSTSKKVLIIVLVILIVLSLFFLFKDQINISNSGNSEESKCIITLFGEEYDVTELRKFHPGGNIYICGTDMTSTYLNQHGNDMIRIQPYKVNK